MNRCCRCLKQKKPASFHKNQKRCKTCSKELSIQNRERKRETDKLRYKEVLTAKRSTLDYRMKSLASSVRCRASLSKIPCDISTETLLEMIKQQGLKCAQTGIEFDMSIGHGKNRLLRAPSVDRIKPVVGYIQSNIQIVCLFYNMAKNNSTDAELWSLMNQAVKNSGGKNDQ